MNGFHDVRFPDAIAYGATGGPGFSTTVVATGSGHERRNADWSAARGRWNVASGLRKRSHIDELTAFFRARRGRAYGFRFRDWSDFAALAVVVGTGDGEATAFQLVKRYASGGVEEVRTITRPVAGTVKVWLDAAEQLSGWSVDTETGIVTFDSAPGPEVVVTADFEFDVPVRFDVDQMDVSLETWEMGNWAQIPVVELRA